MQQTVKIANTLNRELYEQSSLGWHRFHNCYRGKTGTITGWHCRVKTLDGSKDAVRVSFDRPHVPYSLTLWFFKEDITHG